MFYIRHCSDSFTVIDCSLPDDRRQEILDEITTQQSDKCVHRFISTHPDKDHIFGLKDFDLTCAIKNFYLVENRATKDSKSEDFNCYESLRKSPKSFHIYRDRKRCWLNESNEMGHSSGIKILWPDKHNPHFKDALDAVERGESPNNISPIIRYKRRKSASFMWFGDLERDFMKLICDDFTPVSTDILFAPHHGRKSGHVPNKWLEIINPKIVVVGEAPSRELDYYQGWNTITQNTAGDITFECCDGEVHVYVSNPNYSESFLDHTEDYSGSGDFYIGSIKT